MTKNLQEVDIDRIVIEETSEPIPGRTGQIVPEKIKISGTTIKMNENYKQGVKQNAHRVGKLDVTKIEEKHAEMQKLEKEIELCNSKKVNQLSQH